MADLLPDCRLKSPKHVMRGYFPGVGVINWVPVYCANCGKLGKMCPEENMTFMFWMCDPCYEKCGNITGAMMVPDEVYFEKVKQAQLEKYGRILSPPEIVNELSDESSMLSKLAKDRRSP
jgi:hypothetical protein